MVVRSIGRGVVGPKMLLPTATRGDANYNIFIYGEELKLVDEERYLGMTLAATGLGK